jgi:hypothetical protein
LSIPFPSPAPRQAPHRQFGTGTNYKKISGNHRFPELAIKNKMFSLSDSASISYLGIEKVSFPQSVFYPRAQALERFINMYDKKIK